MASVDRSLHPAADLTPEFDVMHVEDDSASAAGFVSKTRLVGIEVDLVSDVVDAREHLRSRQYRLFVIDLEVLDNGKRRRGAGADLVRDLASGGLGGEHVGVPIIVHTAHLGAFEDSGLAAIDEVELIRKPGSVYRRALEIVRPIGPDEVLVEALPMSWAGPEVRGVMIRVPGWRTGEFEVPMATFDGAQLTEIALAEEELYFSGIANLDADNEKDLGLKILELVPSSEPENSFWDD